MTGSSVWATISINGLFCVTLMALFEYYRTKVTDLYAPRTRGSNPKYVPPREGFLAWVTQVHAISDDEMFRIAGMDGYVFLRFLAFCAKVCTFCAPFAALVLIPCYATSPGDVFNNLEKASMANVDQNGSRLWASFVFMYVFSFVFLYLIHKEYENFVTMRKRFFHRDVDIIPVQTRYTVQVENIPSDLRTPEKLLAAFDALFPGEVLYAHVAISTPELDRIVAERDAVRDQLERAIAVYEGSGKADRPTLDLQKLNPARHFVSKEVDSISFLTKRLHKLCARTAKLQRAINIYGNVEEGPDSPGRPTKSLLPGPAAQADEAPTAEGSHHSDSLDSDNSDDEGDAPTDAHGQALPESSTYNPLRGPLTLRKFSAILEDVRNGIVALFMSTTGFVTFKTRKAQLTAVKTAILLEQYPYMTAVQAPPPADVIWANISASTHATEQTAVFSAGAYYGCLAFWGGVMAFVAAISTMSTLETYLPFVRKFDVIAFAVVEGILPVLVVLAFSTMVSEAIAFIARNVEKRKTNSAVEMEVFKWYFMYQIANVYLILVAGSVWSSIVAAIQRPAAIITYLAAAMPSVSTFFVNYLITIWLSGVPYKLIRRGRALEYLIFYYTHSAQYTTRRMMKTGPFRDTRVQYGTELSDVLYALCVVLLYWVISPVVLLFATPLFWSWYYTWKYEYAFVVTRVYESGGELWYKLYQYSMIALLAGTVVFITYMGIKEGVSQGPLLVPLPLIILMCWRHTEMQFKNQSQSMPFDLAIRDDFSHNGADGNGWQAPKYTDFSPEFMKQPNLVCPAEIFPYPYRVDGIPLFDKHGALSEVYVDELAEPVDVTLRDRGDGGEGSDDGRHTSNTRQRVDTPPEGNNSNGVELTHLHPGQVVDDATAAEHV